MTETSHLFRISDACQNAKPGYGATQFNLEKAGAYASGT